MGLAWNPACREEKSGSDLNLVLDACRVYLDFHESCLESSLPKKIRIRVTFDARRLLHLFGLSWVLLGIQSAEKRSGFELNLMPDACCIYLDFHGSCLESSLETETRFRTEISIKCLLQ